MWKRESCAFKTLPCFYSKSKLCVNVKGLTVFARCFQRNRAVNELVTRLFHLFWDRVLSRSPVFCAQCWGLTECRGGVRCAFLWAALPSQPCSFGLSSVPASGRKSKVSKSDFRLSDYTFVNMLTKIYDLCIKILFISALASLLSLALKIWVLLSSSTNSCCSLCSSAHGEELQQTRATTAVPSIPCTPTTEPSSRQSEGGF